jgi:hypothetical protein
MAILTLTATQQCPVSVAPKDAKGNPAQVHDAVWTSSEPETITVTPDATDPLKAMVTAVGPVDEASQVKFEADADTSDGVKPIIGLLDVVVTAGQAVVVEIVAGAPSEQP